MSPPFLAIDHLARRFGAVTAVADVSLDVAEGEFVTFLGPSGSGKSTTLYAVAGLDRPSAGDIRLRGQSLLGVPPHRRNIGMVFQRYTLFPHLDVAGNVGFPLRVRGESPDAIARRVAAMLALVRLEGMGHRLPAQLSGGQQQRVALARALAYAPPLLLMDEPLAALDKALREQIQTEIRRIHRQTGVTILYVTHDQEEALRLSDRIAIFNHGRIEQIGSGEDLYARPATRFVAGFMGDASFLPVRIEPDGPDRASVAFPDGRRLGGLAAPRTGPGTGSGEIMLRPEALRLARPAASGAGALHLPVTVTDCVFLGGGLGVSAVTAWDAPVALRLPAGTPVAVGARLDLTADLKDLHLFSGG